MGSFASKSAGSARSSSTVSTEWTSVRATALLLRDRREALQLADSVLEAEPDNLEAWMVVYEGTRERNRARSARALAEIRRLNPLLRQR